MPTPHDRFLRFASLTALGAEHHFAHSVTSYNYGLQYAVPIMFSVILVALDNIQSHLENPFDQQGEDDVEINVEKFIRNLD